ncbi:3449_t:CDS:1 [Funneliformis mosseae]|uniref:3449_t:CDS:1 n=1 Tax=Funneliformis mosseae TaxID=27381 RepID=A0A9N9GWH0_FUNMO|nr:3449_t:CDS:1 [Funneliformis mosseae]
MILKHNLEKHLKYLNKRIKDLEQSKKKADDENQLLLSFLLNEIGSKDLDNLKELLAGHKLTEILAELDNRKREVQNLNFELSNVSAQFKYSEEKIKAQEKEEDKKSKVYSVGVLKWQISSGRSTFYGDFCGVKFIVLI